MSQTYNPEKWKWALDACQEAITLAEDNGHRLYESPNATAAAAERGEINYDDCFVEPLWNTTEYLWAMGDQTGIEHLLPSVTERAPEAAVQYRRLLHQHRSDVRVRGDVLHAQRSAVGPRPRDHAYRPLCL